MNRKIYYWKLRDVELQLGERTLIMGVLNITPDSFSDGGRFTDPDRAYAHALEMEEQGADIIDIGAESTRPGSERISADQEWQRLVPILKRLRDKLRVPLSLDTYKSEIAERALQYGVQIFNDPSGLTFDPGLAKVAANGNAGLILNHLRGQPETWAKLPPMADPLGTIGTELNATISRARLAGVDRARIVVDPGIGFGKRKEQNNEILAKLKKLADLDYPILVGASRKSFLAQQTEADTLFATAAAVAIAAFNGAHIVRVHDVKQMQSVLLVADEMGRASVIQEVVAAKPATPAMKSRGPRREEEERVRPTRAPLAKPAAAAAVEPPADRVEIEAKADPAPASEPAPPPPARPAFVKREERPAGGRVPGKFSEDRERNRPKRDSGGWDAPPRREFRRDGPPAKGRDFRPKGDRPDGPPKREFRPRNEGPGGPPKREFRPRNEGPGGPPKREFRPRNDGPGGPPKREFRPRNEGPGGPPKREFRPRNEGPGGPPKREFRPRKDGPGGPPKREFRPRTDKPSGPRSGGPPPRRPFRKRP